MAKTYENPTNDQLRATVADLAARVAALEDAATAAEPQPEPEPEPEASEGSDAE